MQAETFLENLALALGNLPKPERRHAGGAVEGADEIGKIVEADVIGDIGYGFVVFGQQPYRASQPRAQQILMWGDAEHAGKQPQEMERADAGLLRNVLQLDLAMRVGFDPERRFDCTAAVPRRHAPLPLGLAGNQL